MRRGCDVQAGAARAWIDFGIMQLGYLGAARSRWIATGLQKTVPEFISYMEEHSCLMYRCLRKHQILCIQNEKFKGTLYQLSLLFLTFHYYFIFTILLLFKRYFTYFLAPEKIGYIQ